MLKLKLQYFGPLMQRANSLEKTLILGKIEGRRRKGLQRMRQLDGITDSMDMSLSKLLEIVKGWVVWRDAVQPSHPLLSPSPPALSLSQHHGLFQWVGSLLQVDKILKVQLQHSPSNEHSGLISLRTAYFDLAVQGNLKSLLQHHSSKTSIL